MCKTLFVLSLFFCSPVCLFSQEDSVGLSGIGEKNLRDLRLGKFDVLVGINLLREGLDLPEVSLVAILDADKEGFLRSARSLTQTAGRAARNINGKVIMYAGKITASMQKMMDDTNRRREKQLAYNEKYNITPRQIVKAQISSLKSHSLPRNIGVSNLNYYVEPDEISIAADPVVQYMSKDQMQKNMDKARKEMEKAAKELDFMEAAHFRDEIQSYKKLLQEKFGEG